MNLEMQRMKWKCIFEMKMHLFTTRGITRSWMDYGNQNRGWTKLGPIDSEHVCIRRESNSVGRADFYTFSLLFLLGGTTTFLLVWKNFVLSIWTKKYMIFSSKKKRTTSSLCAVFPCLFWIMHTDRYYSSALEVQSAGDIAHNLNQAK
jgi:hypothetical protein